MAHRRAVRTLTGTVLALGLLAAGCGTTPDSAPDDVPLPPPAGLSDIDGAEGVPDAAAAPDAPAPGADAAAEPAPAEPAGPPRWFPEVGTTVRLAGISPRDMLPMIEERTVRPGGGERSHEVDVAVGAVGAPDVDVARETYLVTLTDDEVRVALAPDPLRQVPGPAREIPREPKVGQTWSTPAGTCRVEAVQQSATTFEGPREGCVRVRVTSPTGRVTLRWFDPRLGEVRREVLDRADRVLAAWALCGPEPPPVDRFREILLADG